MLARLPSLDPGATVVIALPRGGVPVAQPIAAALGVPLDVVQVRKVGLPGHRELAVAAVTDGAAPALAINTGIARRAGLSEADIRALAEPELAEIDRRRRLWHGARPPVPLRGKTVVVVDDGIATGATMRAALDRLRAEGAARLILAVPVAAADTLADLAPRVDAVVCLATPEPFHAVGAHYADFRQVTDAEVAAALSV
nr:phosphoribosyltransferase family protein [Roseibacterium persicicum]